MKTNIKISIIFGIICFALSMAIAMQINSTNKIGSEVSKNYRLNNLRADVLKYKEKYENKFRELEQVESVLELQRKNSIENNGNLESSENEIKKANQIIGTTEVKGPGVAINLSDSKIDIGDVLDTSSLIVHDIDILAVINELKNAGAEAISINDQRLVTTTGIICGGNIIEINGKKVGAPFEIKAIGFPEQLAAVNRPGGYLDLLEQDSIEVEFTKADEITIPKFTGVMTFDNLITVEK